MMGSKIGQFSLLMLIIDMLFKTFHFLNIYLKCKKREDDIKERR